MPIKQSVPKWLRCGRAVVQLAVLVECTAACSTVLAVDVDWKPLMTIAERKRDSQGALLPLQSYDETIRRGMAFLQDDHLKWFKGPPASLVDENGHTQMPWVYYSNLQHNGAPFTSSVDRFVSYPAFHHALLIRTFVGYWKYAKDARMLQQAIQLANWNIAHSTPGDWPYAHLPYSTFQEKKPGGFRDKTGLMPDKAAIMALAYLQLYEATGETRFFKAAEAIGNTLSQRQRTDGRWPFRVDPKTEVVIEEYTSSVIYAIMLFERLDALNKNEYYRGSRDRAWNWLLKGPIKTKEFRGFYEDIEASPHGRANYDCLDTIRYLLANRTAENGYLEMAKELNAWVEKVFKDKIKGFEPAEGIREQLQCNVVMGIHSLNWASMLLDLSKATGDEKMRQRAIQTANYITYYLQPDNRIVVGFEYRQWWYSCHAGVVLYLLDIAETTPTEMRTIPFKDLTPGGLLKARAELSFRHLQEPYFQWDNVSRVNFEPFPGDAIGRTINGLTLLSQALHQPTPASLQEIMRRVPSVTNPDGYLGPKLPESRANEDVMAGHNGYACGLAEYALWTQDPAAKESLRRMVANLFVPARAAIAGYRETSEAKVDWHLSGGDIGQLFLILDGMTRAYALEPTPEFKATIETAIDRYRKLDLVGLSAQTHAMLSATTGILRWYGMQRRPEDLAFAEALYKQYRALAMTETFENYNWFNKPKWTEACAVSDSFILTVNLWRLTGRAGYLEDAHLILFNGLLPGQLHNGGFGTGPCVGHTTGACRTKLHAEAPFCCSMRGGEALARAIQYSYFQDKDTVVLPFYSSGMATLRFAEGTCKVRQETGYPHKGQVRLEVLESQVNKTKTWRFIVPSWAVRNSFEIRVNGKKAEPCLADSFAEIEVPLVAGTVVEVAFQQERGPRPALNPELAQGASRYFDGPLLLGSATENADEPLTPILDLFAAGGRGGEPYVYFQKQKSQPAVNAGTAGRVPNLATEAQVFRRDRPAEKLPGEVGKLFGALKHDRTLAIMGFVWSKPQKVRQVILQWPESGAMPKPEEIALRWSDAGGLHTAAQPGIIGNGRQWVYTLGNALEGTAVDNLVLAGKSAEGIPETLVVPDVEIIGKP